MAFGTPSIKANPLVGGPSIICGTVLGQTGDVAFSVDLSSYLSKIDAAFMFVSGKDDNLDTIDFDTIPWMLEATLPLPANSLPHIGSVDLSSGHDWTTTQDFSINVNGAGATTVTLNSNCTTLEEVIDEINNELSVAGVTGVEAYDAGSNYVGLRATSPGSNSVVLAAGVPDALVTLGWTAGTYTDSAITVHFTAIGS